MTTETICQESNIAEFIRHSHKDVIFFHIHIYDLWFYQAGRNRANLPQLELLDPGKYLATLGVNLPSRVPIKRNSTALLSTSQIK